MPLNAKVIDYDRKSASLSWQAPLKDGGSPITGYFVECLKIRNLKNSDKEPEWARVNLKPTPHCHFKAPGLREDIEYRYLK